MELIYDYLPAETVAHRLHGLEAFRQDGLAHLIMAGVGAFAHRLLSLLHRTANGKGQQPFDLRGALAAGS